MIAVAVTSVSTVLLFVAAAIGARVVATARQALSTVNAAAHVMRDSALDEDARERQVQALSLRLLRLFASLTARALLTVLAAAAPIALAHAAGLAPWRSTVAFLTRWDVIVISTLVVMGGAWGGAKLCRR
ncbi:MAG: hypothetical protein MI723_19715 [Caulobacterales bacterium]|nr:hypothetical protein [Caulobacterales bacterium]